MARITFRTEDSERKLLEKAAQKDHRTLSNFIITYALKAAREVLAKEGK